MESNKQEKTTEQEIIDQQEDQQIDNQGDQDDDRQDLPSLSNSVPIENIQEYIDQQEQKAEQQEESKQQSTSEKVKDSQVRYYEWAEEMTQKAQEILNQEGEDNILDSKQYERLEKDAKRNWDIFYKNNKTNFYKDRHYIKYEFTELADAIQKLEEGDKSKQFLLLDAGCGVGNGFYPLFKEFKGNLMINCCDFSPRAVNFVKENPDYDPLCINAQTCDLVNEEIPFEKGTADFGLFLFVLSAISPENHQLVANKLFEAMNVNGILYFRDYGKYDLAQLRLAQRKNQKLKDNFYIRSDKTRAYYFTIEEVADLFVQAGFVMLENKYHYRLVENRKDNKRMHRVWIQAKFQRPALKPSEENK